MSDVSSLVEEYNRIQRRLENVERELQEMIDAYAQAGHPPYPGDNVEEGLTGPYHVLMKSADGVIDRTTKLKALLANAVL